jgi:hypothetical protein
LNERIALHGLYHHMSELRFIWIIYFFAFNAECIKTYAQFTNVISASGIVANGADGEYGHGISLYDFNKDGLSDITFCTMDAGVNTYINDGLQFEQVFLFPPIYGDIKHPIWVDYDNDGDPDFFSTIFGNGCRLFRNDGDLSFTDVTQNLNQPTPFGKSFGACWGDYDNDGFVDVYVGNYDFILPEATTNWLFHNNGDGTFSEVAATLGIDNSYKATFQPVWINLNNDPWLDLFVINDKYHGNNLYLGTGTNFIDVSSEYNLNEEMEAMNNSWSDYDHDLDFDVYISNTTQGSRLMRNDNVVFLNTALEAGVEINSVTWSALWIDYDLNGWDDLHVATNSPFINNNVNPLFRSMSDGTFYSTTIQGDNKSTLSSASGDINNDGYPDFAEMHSYPFDMSLFQNNGGSNHWLKCELEGTVSNRDGIGALLQFTIGDQTSIKQTFCGDGFLGQNSQYVLLGLSDQLQVDSLSILWPSGWIDHYENLSADQMLHFVEGETFACEIENISQRDLCPGDSVLLSVIANGNSIWSDSTTGSQRWIFESGTYSVQVTNELGFVAMDTITVLEFDLPEWNVVVTNATCFQSNDAIVDIEVMDDLNAVFFWNENTSPLHIDSVASGQYQLKLIDENGCIQIDTINIHEPEELIVNVATQTACFGQEAAISFEISGGTGSYLVNGEINFPEALYAGEYEMLISDDNGCETNLSFSVVENTPMQIDATVFNAEGGNNGSIEVIVNGGVLPYTYLWSDGSENPWIENIGSGIYHVIVMDSIGCTVDSSFTLIDLRMDEMHHHFDVFPNPFENELNIILNEPSAISIYDLTGRIVFETNLQGNKNIVPLGHLNPSLYLLRIGAFYKTLLKEK